MKKRFFLISISVLLYVSGLGNVITVDNNAGAGADYSALQEAVDAADVEDTIQIHVSHISYGNVTIKKRLVLIGPGHYPEAAAYTGATVENITLQNGSAGTIITGLRIRSIAGASRHNTDNITIENNFFYLTLRSISGSGLDGGSSDNWIVRGNVFYSQSYCGGCESIDMGVPLSGSNDNWLISNNFIHVDGSNSIFANTNAATLIVNNTMIHTGGDANNNYTFFEKGTNQNAVVKNNIFIATDIDLKSVNVNCQACVFESNLTYHANAAMDDLPGDNLNNTDPEFVNAPEYGWDYSFDFNVGDESPAKGAGTDGTDLGIYGTDYGFSKYGYPRGLPLIESFEVANQVVTQGQDIVIKVKARAGDK